jgi:hypothetical protein
MKESSTWSELFFFTREVFKMLPSIKADLSFFIVSKIWEKSIGDKTASTFR